MMDRTPLRQPSDRAMRNDLLKIIAVVTMLLDHIGYIFLPQFRWLRSVGRIAFPIYAYSIAAGYRYSTNRKDYAKRLLLFALISYMPYVYFRPSLTPNFIAFNVIFLLLMGLGAIALWQRVIKQLDQLRSDNHLRAFGGGLIAFIIFFAYICLPQLLYIALQNVRLPLSATVSPIAVSYGSYGLILIMIFYWFYEKPIAGIAAFILLSLFDAYISGAVYLADISSLATAAQRFQALYHLMKSSSPQIWRTIIAYDLSALEGFFFQARALLGVILVYVLKNRSFRLQVNKMFFYWFYPVHITVIIVVYYLLTIG